MNKSKFRLTDDKGTLTHFGALIMTLIGAGFVTLVILFVTALERIF